jgi:hypothetical protein
LYVRLFCLYLCCVCRYRPCNGLIIRLSTPTVCMKELRNWRRGQGPTEGCRAIDERLKISTDVHDVPQYKISHAYLHQIINFRYKTQIQVDFVLLACFYSASKPVSSWFRSSIRRTGLPQNPPRPQQVPRRYACNLCISVNSSHSSAEALFRELRKLEHINKFTPGFFCMASKVCCRGKCWNLAMFHPTSTASVIQ